MGFQHILMDSFAQIPEANCRKEQLPVGEGENASLRSQFALSPQVLSVPTLFPLQRMCTSLRSENTSGLLETSPNPTVWLSVMRQNFCLCFEYRSGGLACR